MARKKVITASRADIVAGSTDSMLDNKSQVLMADSLSVHTLKNVNIFGNLYLRPIANIHCYITDQNWRVLPVQHSHARTKLHPVRFYIHSLIILYYYQRSSKFVCHLACSTRLPASAISAAREGENKSEISSHHGNTCDKHCSRQHPDSRQKALHISPAVLPTTQRVRPSD